jgi:hypothetical protein
MRSLKVISLILILISTHEVSFSQVVLSGQAARTPEEYAVYSALIREKFGKHTTKMAVIVSPTFNQSASDFGYLSGKLPLSLQTFEDYNARNKEPDVLKKLFSLKIKYVLVEREELESLFRGGDLEQAWKLFYKRYPGSGGYIALSNVGFNDLKDQALVYSWWMCGSLCGEGYFTLLRKRAQGWQIEKEYLFLVS